MKKLFFLLVENIVNNFDNETALFLLKKLMVTKWNELNLEEQEALEEAINKVRG